ncbi:flagellar basal body P-ring formation chaperone FlgA [Roseobacteraceae bacterium S113]
MRQFWLTFVFICAAAPLFAEVLVPTRTIRPNTLLTAQDFVVQNRDVTGAISAISQVQGMESRVALYAGRPIRPGDVGPPALVERNGMVRLIFSQGGLQIFAEGRALGRGAAGDAIRVMNLASRATLFGVVQADGSVKVGN